MVPETKHVKGLKRKNKFKKTSVKRKKKKTTVLSEINRLQEAYSRVCAVYNRL